MMMTAEEVAAAVDDVGVRGCARGCARWWDMHGRLGMRRERSVMAVEPLHVAVEQLAASPQWAAFGVVSAGVGYHHVDDAHMKVLVSVSAAATKEKDAAALHARLSKWPRLNGSAVAV